mmetsp:Transcript_32998/g.102322  ORF Transcript_32998/g.102322 Transcript_32998/m.102322 type:complete len:96 (-) Transcript_32998:543-830(-)
MSPKKIISSSCPCRTFLFCSFCLKAAGKICATACREPNEVMYLTESRSSYYFLNARGFTIKLSFDKVATLCKDAQDFNLHILALLVGVNFCKVFL